jgi:F-type H+-transporting ATPase subunit b
LIIRFRKLHIAITGLVLSVLVIVLIAGIMTDRAWAGDLDLFTRHNYDLIMRWINFIILAVVAIKFGRKPLLQFLDNQKKSISQPFEKLEAQKKQAEAQVRESQKLLDNSRNRLKQLQDRIITDGQNQKDRIISEAQKEAQIMMEAAQNKIEGQRKMAYANVRAELIDMASELALARLPEVITSRDQDQMIHTWLEQAEK